MNKVRVGGKIYVVIDSDATNTYLTRKIARANRTPDSVLIEHELTLAQQIAIAKIANSLTDLEYVSIA